MDRTKIILLLVLGQAITLFILFTTYSAKVPAGSVDMKQREDNYRSFSGILLKIEQKDSAIKNLSAQVTELKDQVRQLKVRDFGIIDYSSKEALDAYYKRYITREIPDSRDPACKNQEFSPILPSASIVIPFHTEIKELLVVTLKTILYRTPPHLLDEIILVDDVNPETIDTDLMIDPKIRVLHNEKREGLIRAKINGADEVRSPVIIFLEAHCEVNVGWIEPLLQLKMIGGLYPYQYWISLMILEKLMENTRWHL